MISALNVQAELPRVEGAAGLAAGLHGEALALARELGDHYHEARALQGMAEATHALGDTAGARRLWAAASELFTAIEVPEAAEVRRRLEVTAVGGPTD